jgi:hypothetical protein
MKSDKREVPYKICQANFLTVHVTDFTWRTNWKVKVKREAIPVTGSGAYKVLRR